MEDKILRIPARHWPAIILALVLGLLLVFPFQYYKYKLGDRFQGIERQMIDDELFYLARIKDVMDGHPTLSNAYLWEHKNGPPQQLFLAEYLLAQPLRLFNLNVLQGRVLYNFILPAVVFLLTYAAIFLITKSKLWANLLAVFLLFGQYLYVFLRPVSPQFNFIFWLSQFILIWLLVSGRQSRWLGMLAGINLGFLFYIYPYYWTYYVILFGILIFIYFFQDRSLSIQILKILLLGVFLGSYYLYLTFQASKLPYFEETLTRLQLIYTRFPSGINVLLWSVPVLLLFFAGWRLKWLTLDKETIFFVSAIAAVIIAVNQHLITGKNFEFSSHYIMQAVFLAVFGSGYFLSRLPNHILIYLKKPLMAIILLVVLINLQKYFGLAVAFNREDPNQKYAAILSWLKSNTPKDSVIYADDYLSRLIPVYTADNVFYDRYANLFLMSDQEVINRFIINHYFEKFDEPFVVQNVRSIYGVRYVDQHGHTVQSNKLRKLLGLKPEPEVYLPEEAVSTFLKTVHTVQSADLASQLKKYRLDYIVWDKQLNPEWRFNTLKFARPVYSDSRFTIYTVSL